MRTLPRIALLSALLAPLAACGDIADAPDAGVVQPDAPIVSTEGAIAYTWNLVDAGAAAGCPTGATAATLVSQPASGDAYRDLYDCSAGAGVASDLPAGVYTTWIEIGDGTTFVAQSEAAEVTVVVGETATAIFEVDIANGFFDVSWTIAGSTCAAVNAGGGSVLSTLSGTTTGFDDIYDCAAGEAPAFVTTAPLPVGAYVVVVAALDQADQAIGEAAPLQPTIEFGNQYVDLGTVTINLF